MKKQIIVLRELLDIGRKMSVSEISRNTDLTKRQVHNALYDLKNRNLIVKEKEISGAKQKVPPTSKIYVEINEKSIKRIRQLIKNDRRD